MQQLPFIRIIKQVVLIGLLCMHFNSFSLNSFNTSNGKLIISSTNKSYHLNPYAGLFSTTDTLTGNQALLRLKEGEIDLAEAKVNQGMNTKDHGYWLVFELENQTSEPSIYLEIDYAQLDYAQLYEIRNDSAVLLFETGDRFTFQKRPIRNRNFVFPISIFNSETKQFLLNVDKRGSAIRFPINVYSEIAFSQKESRESVFYTVYFSFSILIILLSIIIGVKLKKEIFLWYSLHVFMISLWALTVLGYSYQYLIPDYPILNTHFLPLVTSTFNLCFLLYVRVLFNTKNHLPRFHKLMNVIIVVIITFYLFWALFPQYFISIATKLFIFKYTISSLIVVFTYSAAIRYIKIDYFISRIFIVAYTFLFIGTSCKILSGYGIVEESWFILDPLILGFLGEVVIMSTAMIVLLLKIIEDRENLIARNKLATLKLSQEINKNKSQLIDLKSGAILSVNDIISIKSDGHYLEFKLIDKPKPEVDRHQIKYILENLPSNFVQIHRSHVVNVEHIRAKQANKVILKDGSELPVSRTFKDSLNEAMNIIT